MRTRLGSGVFVLACLLAIVGVSALSAGHARAAARVGGYAPTPPVSAHHFTVRVVPDALSPIWFNLVPSGAPPQERQQASAVYDPISDDMTIFGGCGHGFCLNDVWALSNADGAFPAIWSQLNPLGTPPSARGEQTSVYDPGTNSMIMFGGNPNEGTCNGSANDVWLLTSANGFGTPAWVQLFPTGTLPTPRSNHSAVYDVATNRMIVFAGINACSPNYLNDVWVLSNANGLGGTPAWTQLAITGALPGLRSGQSAVYDPNTNRMIIYGGTNQFNGFGDVWVLTDANGLAVDGSPHWMQLPVTGGPGIRAGQSAVYDAETNTMFVFAGGSPETNDVWALSHANGLGGAPAWHLLMPVGGPPGPRTLHTAVYYNPARHRMTIFSGSVGSTFYNDVWVLTGVR